MIILAIDLGKFNSMCCFWDRRTQQHRFQAAATRRDYSLPNRPALPHLVLLELQNAHLFLHQSICQTRKGSSGSTVGPTEDNWRSNS
jgi:hypothetical protein